MQLHFNRKNGIIKKTFDHSDRRITKKESYCMKKILVTLPLSDAQKEFLESHVDDRNAYEFYYYADNAVDEAFVKDMNIVIGCVPPKFYKDHDKIEWVQLHSAGFETYAAPGVLPEHCILSNATGAYGLAVSEHMIAMTFDILRHFQAFHDKQRNHIWETDGLYHSVEGSTTVVLGLGDIGGDYARKMKGMGAYVIGVRKHLKDKPDYVDEQYTVDELDQVLPRADILAMVIPGGPESYHIMDERRLGLMKDDSILINVGRGNAIDPAALKACLKAGKFYGVGLDVTEPEPLPSDDELWDLPRVLITPHSAGKFFLPETVNRILKIAAANLHAYVTGGEMKNVVKR